MQEDISWIHICLRVCAYVREHVGYNQNHIYIRHKLGIGKINRMVSYSPSVLIRKEACLIIKSFIVLHLHKYILYIVDTC